ncbi:MAG: RluA family pseudouridine synthase [Chlamydiia bacterium]
MTKAELTYEGEQQTRLDHFLSESYPTLSRTYFEKVIGQGHVLVNHKPSKKGLKLQSLDEICITFPPFEPLDLTPVAMEIPIFYEDDFIAVIYKHPNLVCHPAAGTKEPTLIHGLLHHFQDLQGADPIRPGLVHRLDKDTSGVMIIAKTPQTHELLCDQFKARSIKKTYLALVHRDLNAPQNPLVVQAPIGRSLKDRKKMAVVMDGGKEAHTAFISLAHEKNMTLIQAFPKTGRTHQIRVHLQHINHPIVGDPLYGFFGCDSPLKPPRILLHAHTIGFTHPISKTQLSFTAPIPADFQNFLISQGFFLKNIL